MKTNLSHYSLHGINQNQQSKKNSQNNFETTSVLSNAAAVRCQFKDISNLFPVLQHTYKNAPNYTNSFVLFDNFYCLWQLKRNINEKALRNDYHFILNSKGQQNIHSLRH